VSSRRRTQEVDVTVISGLSGAGRSEAAKALEDLGWYVIDNLPPALIGQMLSLAMAAATDIERIALVIDVRGGAFFGEAERELAKLRRHHVNFRLVFLEASDEVLERRFAASRRRHPLSDRLVTGIQQERELTHSFRDGADVILDTSELTVRQLRRRMATYFSVDEKAEGLQTTLISFGYKYGLPLDADIVLDLRFLPNPHWVEGLRELTGEDEPVRDYVLTQELAIDFMSRVKDLFAVLLPGYQAEGRHYLTVGLGCTGGRHRSVVLTQEIADFIQEKGYSAKVIHRDVERATQAQ
jgi:RNase adapter protein RapZ